jgi:hypothetical protein
VIADPIHRIRLNVQVGVRLRLNRKSFLLAAGVDPDSNGLHLSIGPVGQADVEQSTVKPSDGPA